jgi:hypothetical protein
VARGQAVSKRPVFQVIPGYSGLFQVNSEGEGETRIAEAKGPKSKVEAPTKAMAPGESWSGICESKFSGDSAKLA